MNRRENIELSLELDYNQVQQFSRELTILGERSPLPVSENDTFSIHYTFSVEYLGDVESKLRAILNLLSCANVTKADFKEWNHGYSIIMAIGRLIERISKKLEPKKKRWQRLREWLHV